MSVASEPPLPHSADEIRWALVTRGWPAILACAYTLAVAAEPDGWAFAYAAAAITTVFLVAFPRAQPLRLASLSTAVCATGAHLVMQVIGGEVSISTVGTGLFVMCHLVLIVTTHWLVVSPEWVLRQMEPHGEEMR